MYFNNILNIIILVILVIKYYEKLLKLCRHPEERLMMLLPPGVVVVICSSEVSLSFYLLSHRESPCLALCQVCHHSFIPIFFLIWHIWVFESSSVPILVPSLRDISRQEWGAYMKGYSMLQELASILKIKEYQVFSVQGHALKVFCEHTS